MHGSIKLNAYGQAFWPCLLYIYAFGSMHPGTKIETASVGMDSFGHVTGLR
jgi:hypothetical protein